MESPGRFVAFAVQLTQKPTNEPPIQPTNSPQSGHLHDLSLLGREPRGIQHFHHRDPLLRRHRRLGAVANRGRDAAVELEVVAGVVDEVDVAGAGKPCLLVRDDRAAERGAPRRSATSST